MFSLFWSIVCSVLLLFVVLTSLRLARLYVLVYEKR